VEAEIPGEGELSFSPFSAWHMLAAGTTCWRCVSARECYWSGAWLAPS
jgi:hypothetical protein